MEADDLDRAADLSRSLADAAVEAARRKAQPEQVQNPDGTWPHTECVDCDEDIPTARLAMGKIRCVYCQAEREPKPGYRK